MPIKTETCLGSDDGDDDREVWEEWREYVAGGVNQAELYAHGVDSKPVPPVTNMTDQTTKGTGDRIDWKSRFDPRRYEKTARQAHFKLRWYMPPQGETKHETN